MFWWLSITNSISQVRIGQFGNSPSQRVKSLSQPIFFYIFSAFDLPMNISYSNTEGESIDDQVQTFLDNDQFYEAVLPLPTCPSTYGCRSVVEAKDPNNPNNEFNLVDAFHIQPQVLKLTYTLIS